MSDISDPGRAGRGDRKRATRLIDAAYAAGRLTAANRALRLERVETAHTKGDLAVLVRDLKGAAAAPAASIADAPVSTVPDQARSTESLGSAIPPDEFAAMLTGGSQPRTIDLAGQARNVGRVVMFAVLAVLVASVVGVAGIVGTVVDGVGDAFDAVDTSPGVSAPSPGPSLNLQTEAGWTDMVSAVEQETGSTRVYDAVVYPEYASVNAPADEGAMRHVYRGGEFQDFDSPVTPVFGRPVDLADVDPTIIEGLLDRTAKRQDMPEYDSAYMIVHNLSGTPSITVYVQREARLPRWSIYDFDGKVVGGTPDGST